MLFGDPQRKNPLKVPHILAFRTQFRGYPVQNVCLQDVLGEQLYLQTFSGADPRVGLLEFKASSVFTAFMLSTAV